MLRWGCQPAITTLPEPSLPLLAKLATLPEKMTDPALVVPGTPEWDLAVTDPPADFDYDTWIGPSKMEPYIEARVPRTGAGITTPVADS